MSHRRDKSLSPGYQAGNYWLVCDVCGKAMRQKDAKTRWDGAVVCPSDWEPRHPQDFVRAVEDIVAPQGLVRTEPEEVYIEGPDCPAVSRQGVAGYGVAGCMVAGLNMNLTPECSLEQKQAIAGIGQAGCIVTGYILQGY